MSNGPTVDQLGDQVVEESGIDEAPLTLSRLMEIQDSLKDAQLEPFVDRNISAVVAFGDNGGPHGQTVTVEITDELCIELKEYLEFKINVAEGQRSMYADDCGKLWSNWGELEYGCRCQISAYGEVLSKIERMGK